MGHKKLSDIFRVGTGLRLLNGIINHKKQGVILIDLDGTIMFANSLINGLLRSGEETIRNSSVFKFVSPNDAVHITNIVSSLIEEANANSAVHKVSLRIEESIYQAFETYGVGIYSDAGMLECVELCLVEAGSPVSESTI